MARFAFRTLFLTYVPEVANTTSSITLLFPPNKRPQKSFFQRFWDEHDWESVDMYITFFGDENIPEDISEISLESEEKPEEDT